LTVSDATATREFYGQVVGWSAKDVEMDDASKRYADYKMLGDDGNAAAGICHARRVNQDVPPVWMLYLPVGDLAESLRRVPQEGGRIVKETPANERGYAYAVLQDPVGAYVALVPG
jgi:predicted enzyme related to lactoylglutathione lyase